MKIPAQVWSSRARAAPVVPAVTALAAWPILGARVGATAVVGLAVAGTGLWLARSQR